MKPPRMFCVRLWLATSCLLSATLSVAAQVAATGAIEGRVSSSSLGEFLENARVVLVGQNQETLTDADGHYHFANVPAGVFTVKASYSGFAAVAESVNVEAGATAVRDMALGAEGVVKMSEYAVTAPKETDAQAIAINDQRYAANIESVVTADQFGTVTDGTPGEVLKFLPGISLEYSAGEARTIRMNGAPADYTPVTVNGVDLASTSGELSASKVVQLDQVSINSMSRIEVLKSPTPESPGAALAGSVNMVPRSAFEYKKPTFRYTAFVNFHPTERSLDRTPGPWDSPTHKVQPGANFSLVMPVNNRFGFTLDGNAVTVYAPGRVMSNSRKGLNSTTGGTFAATTPDKPYLYDFSVTEDQRMNRTNSLGATADYKISPRDRLSLAFQITFIGVQHSSRNIDYTVGGVNAGDFTVTSTHGATGRGEVQLNLGNNRYWSGTTSLTTLTYRHLGAVWTAEAGSGYSYGGLHNRDLDNPGSFRNVTVRRTGVTVAFDDINYLNPGRITVTDGTTGAPVNVSDLNSYALYSAESRPTDQSDVHETAYANLRRQFSPWGVPLQLKLGLDERQSIRDMRGASTSYNYLGAAGKQVTTPTAAGGAANAAGIILDPSLSTRLPPYGVPQLQWPDSFTLWDLYKLHPDYFQSDPNAIYRSAVGNSKRALELISAIYVRGDLTLLRGRLRLIGGLRAEQTNINAYGPLTDPTGDYQRDASGHFVLDATGKPILIKSDALGKSQLTFIERGQHTKKEYLRYFPNLNAGYNLTENLIARAAYYWSVGRPAYSQYANGLTLPDTESTAANQVISVNNPDIKAWKAETYMARVEYYFQRVGQFSVGAFRRNFQNFFGGTRFPATPEFLAAFDLDPAVYGKYDVFTNYNLPDKVWMSGMDVDYRQSLTFLPQWARGVQVWANVTAQRSGGANDVAASEFRRFIPRTYNWGWVLNREKFNVRMNWNYRGKNRQGAITGSGIEAGTYFWGSKQMYIDLGGEYYLSRKFGLFANLRNVDDATNDTKMAGPSTPAVANFRSREDYHPYFTCGVKGSF